MKRIMLVCSGGMSTGLLAAKIKLAARKMGEITEEQRQHIFKQLDSTIDIFLAAKRSVKEEK